MLKGKIHRAVVKQADLNYVGSITVDTKLLEAAGILEYEMVQIVDVENGNRFETYTIAGEPGSGMICLNGAAARQVAVGLVPLFEVGADDAGAGRQHTHEPGVEEVAGRGAVVADAPGHGIVHQRLQDALEVGVADVALRLREAVELHGHEQLVADVDLVVRQDEAGV